MNVIEYLVLFFQCLIYTLCYLVLFFQCLIYTLCYVSCEGKVILC